MEIVILILVAVIVGVYFLCGNRDHPAPKADYSQDRYRPKKSIEAPRRKPRSQTVGELKSDHAPPPDIPSSRELKGRAYVIDGDTIVVSKVKVRLAGIDAPELDQPWGQKSKWEMVKICKGKVIRVELTGETSYDRLVGTCYLPDGRDIGAQIVKAGLALDGGHFSEGKYRHLEEAGVRQRLKNYGRWC